MTLRYFGYCIVWYGLHIQRSTGYGVFMDTNVFHALIGCSDTDTYSGTNVGKYAKEGRS